MPRALRFFAPALACAFLAGCAHDVVVVMPDSDGHIGGVVVQTGGGKSVVLDKAYASDTPGDSKAGVANAEEVKKEFSEALAARPKEPGHHKLYFLNGSDAMTEESKTEFETKVKTDVDDRLAAEIVIIGYTDRVGSLEDNDRLSRERAESIKKLLQEKGNLRPGIQITTDGRGERDDPDADSTPNPNERYVDIIVQ
jgi:outer membrane protein OmpA-like peptidoglycan-associated protein